VRRAAAFAAVLALACGPLLPGAAGADPIGQPAPTGPDAANRMRLEVDTMVPRVVTAATTQVSVTGTVTNTGDRRIDDVEVQLQRGAKLSTEREVRDSANAATDSAKSPFTEVSAALEPGESADVTLSVPVRGNDKTLGIDEPGVYPVLVNINGKPEYGGRARLAAVSVQLPVLALPDGPAAPVPPATRGVSIVWPLLDTQPRQVPTTDGRTLLTDDDLADSLAVGGRLYSLVNTVHSLPQDSPLLSSLCFAVDPDLLRTVTAMKDGYQVRAGGGQIVDGKGKSVAEEWLSRVRAVTKGRCVISVPFADADLAALSRAGALGLTTQALAGSSVVADTLDVQPAKEMVWPAGGSFDQRTLLDLAQTGPRTALVNPGALQDVTGAAPYQVTGIQAANPVRLLPYDSLISDALAGQEHAAPAGESPTPRRVSGSVQNGLAALIFRTVFDDQAPGAPVVITPPRRWTASAADLTAFLETTQQLVDGNLATPKPLQDLAGAEEPGSTGVPSYTVADTTAEIPTAVTTDVNSMNVITRDLSSAMVKDNTSGVDPHTLLAPIENGMLQAVSTAWRGDPDGVRGAVAEVRGQLDALRGEVSVVDPGRPLALASGDSPIQVIVQNHLPVSVAVRINLNPTPGLRPEAYPAFLIPPGHSFTRYVPAEVIRSGRFTVDASLSTPGGTPLGSNARLELNSTSYGIITVAVTGTAGVILVLLVIRRISRRVKAARAA
jgi:uncharacterized protein DUF6049